MRQKYFVHIDFSVLVCLTAGCIAQKMGLPLRLVAAVNKNDIFHRAVQQGDFSLGDAEKTLASAMDIQVLKLNSRSSHK